MVSVYMWRKQEYIAKHYWWLSLSVDVVDGFSLLYTYLYVLKVSQIQMDNFK